MSIDCMNKTKFLDINWLCLYLVLAALPVIELLGFLYGQPPSLPASRALAAEVLGLVLMASGAAQLGFTTQWAQRLFLVWIVLSIPVILYSALPLSLGFFLDFARATIVFLAGVAVLVQLERRSLHFRRLASFVVGCTGLLLGGSCVYGMLLITLAKLPLVYDPVLYRFEGILGLSLTSIFYAILFYNHLTGNVFLALYNFLNIAVILAAASEILYAPNWRQTGLFLQFLVIAAVGYLLYYVTPAVDPANFFCSAFPNHLPAVQSVAMQAVSVPACAPVFDPRNTMPSLHAAWAIVIVLALRHSPLWHKILGALFLASIVIATLGLGGHYTVDWLGALALVLLVRGVCALHLPLATAARRDAILIGAALLVCWIIAVRGAPVTLGYPGGIRLLAIASAILPVSVWGEIRLARAEREQRHVSMAVPQGVPVLNS